MQPRSGFKAASIVRDMVAIMFIGIIVLTIAQVFLRFVINRPLIWSEELVRLLLVWMTMLGAGVISYDDNHLAVPSFAEMLPYAGEFALYVLRQVLTWVFLVAATVTSVDVLRAAHTTYSGALNIPFSFWRAAAPAGCILIFFFSAVSFFRNVQRFRAGTFKTSGNREDDGVSTE